MRYAFIDFVMFIKYLGELAPSDCKTKVGVCKAQERLALLWSA